QVLSRARRMTVAIRLSRALYRTAHPPRSNETACAAKHPYHRSLGMRAESRFRASTWGRLPSGLHPTLSRNRCADPDRRLLRKVLGRPLWLEAVAPHLVEGAAEVVARQHITAPPAPCVDVAKRLDQAGAAAGHAGELGERPDTTPC